MSLVQDTLRGLVSRVEIRTTLGPSLVLDDPFGDTPGVGNAAAQILRPSIIAYTAGGDKLFSTTPYGDPGVSKWPVVVFGGGLLLAWLSWRAFGRRG